MSVDVANAAGALRANLSFHVVRSLASWQARIAMYDKHTNYVRMRYSYRQLSTVRRRYHHQGETWDWISLVVGASFSLILLNIQKELLYDLSPWIYQFSYTPLFIDLLASIIHRNRKRGEPDKLVNR